MIGRRGRSRATAEAVRPVKVGTRIAFAPSASARSQAAFDMALPIVGSSLGLGNLVAVAEARLDGARDPVHVRTASTGYSPIAVSPESISAEVPSRIAFATSLASARVGSGWWTIDSSICVAVITGFPRSSASEDDPLLQQRHGGRRRSRRRGRRARP